MLRQIVRAGRIDQSFYTSLLYDGYATGNAVLVVALVGLIPGLRGWSLTNAAFAAISSIMRAALVALVIWGIGVYLFKRYGQMPVSFRLVGFANVALIPEAITPWAGPFWLLLTLASAIWFFLALRVIARSQFDLEHPEDSFLGAAGVLGWYVGTILF